MLLDQDVSKSPVFDEVRSIGLKNLADRDLSIYGSRSLVQCPRKWYAILVYF